MPPPLPALGSAWRADESLSPPGGLWHRIEISPQHGGDGELWLTGGCVEMQCAVYRCQIYIHGEARKKERMKGLQKPCSSGQRLLLLPIGFRRKIGRLYPAAASCDCVSGCDRKHCYAGRCFCRSLDIGVVCFTAACPPPSHERRGREVLGERENGQGERVVSDTRRTFGGAARSIKRHTQ